MSEFAQKRTVYEIIAKISKGKSINQWSDWEFNQYLEFYELDSIIKTLCNLKKKKKIII